MSATVAAGHTWQHAAQGPGGRARSEKRCALKDTNVTILNMIVAHAFVLLLMFPSVVAEGTALMMQRTHDQQRARNHLIDHVAPKHFIRNTAKALLYAWGFGDSYRGQRLRASTRT